MPQCDRCNQETKTHSMSWFNTDQICLKCKSEESEHPLYKKAKEIENEEVKKGNHNYPGLFSDKSWADIKNVTDL